MPIHRPVPYKAEKLTEMIHHLAAKFVHQESSGSSLITVTKVSLSPNKKVASIFFTTLPDDRQDTALAFLKRKAGDFKIFARENSRIGILPTFKFEIDNGERNRQRIETLLSREE